MQGTCRLSQKQHQLHCQCDPWVCVQMCPAHSPTIWQYRLRSLRQGGSNYGGMKGCSHQNDDLKGSTFTLGWKVIHFPLWYYFIRIPICIKWNDFPFFYRASISSVIYVILVSSSITFLDKRTIEFHFFSRISASAFSLNLTFASSAKTSAVLPYELD